MQCANCGKEIRDAAKVCGYCGHQLEITPAKCPQCGKETRDGAKVCGYCGHQLAASTQSPEPKPEPPPVEKETEPEPIPAIQAEAKLKAAAHISKPARPSSFSVKNIPAWTWGATGFIGVTIIAVIIFLNSGRPSQPGSTTAAPNSQVITFLRACGESATARANQPLRIRYGYWGALEEYFQENYDFMDFRISINGERYYGDRVEQPVGLANVPCVDLANWDTDWQQNGLFMYDILELESLPEGEYQVNIAYYLNSSVHDGLVGDDGELVVWGPGEVLVHSFKLIIEP